MDFIYFVYEKKHLQLHWLVFVVSWNAYVAHHYLHRSSDGWSVHLHAPKVVDMPSPDCWPSLMAHHARSLPVCGVSLSVSVCPRRMCHLYPKKILYTLDLNHSVYILSYILKLTLLSYNKRVGF
jgi:hypothetical protein